MFVINGLKMLEILLKIDRNNSCSTGTCLYADYFLTHVCGGVRRHKQSLYDRRVSTGEVVQEIVISCGISHYRNNIFRG